MKVTLFDFQKDALNELRKALVKARQGVSLDDQHVVAFSAATGSGKTIMMTALFEAILDEPDDQLAWPLDWAPQPDAVILWVSDMPELNEQTKLKVESKSDKVYRVNQLITIDAYFDAPRLEGGRIYFINTQKLAVNQPLTNRGDGREHLIWETLTNTARAIPDRFYVVIDEAHRGMTSGRGAQAAQTLMQRFLLGYPEVGLVKMPMVIGVSATPKRFLDLIANAEHTVTTHKVTVPAEEVRKSGLLKDRILIHHPEAATTAEMALLEEAARRWGQMTAAWGAYCQAEKEPTVWPVLVVQIENGSKTDLDAALTVIESAIGRRLNEGEVAHAMHDTGDLDVGGRRVRKVDASRIDADKNIGVVFFKTSLSTGWDCPRAEVMMSFRRAADHTYIAQLLGRMVRTPLARRIEKDAALNDVHLFLPYFDTGAVESVVASLHNAEDVPPAETGSSRHLVVLQRREGTEAVFAALDELITYRVNAARAQSPLRRYMAITRSLTIDEIDDDAWATAKRQIVEWMGQHIAAIKSADQFDAAAKAITQVGLRTLTVNNGTGVAEPTADYHIDASGVDIDRLFEEAGRAFSHGLQMEYWRAHADRDPLEVKVEAIVLARNAAEMAALESQAEVAFDALYDQHKKSISKLKEQRRTNYEKLRLATAKPNEVPWHLPASIDFRRLPADDLWERHLYVEGNGQFRTELGGWEKGVLKEELAKPEVVGWLRNLDRKPWSLEIPYETGGDVRPMFPDLVVIREVGGEYLADILEPHDPSLGDNFEKAVGLAKFAEKHGALFGRIQLIRKQSSAGGEHFARLEINQAATIKKLLLITSNPQLDELFTAVAGK
ncbi:DEAD/DEAH box helicase [Pseudomonas aeruginosa]|uniref:DEAD/DEAH box helicase n=1 Tax=Pseudomonas aeruginosa TaxID=287 RepID=UPI00053D3998|nr:DEAD/DEAH box helicase family protein [Pseudomonas aeruginosa]MBV5580701.1 DEAD/DEAH box helicase family protein [Pseudomonas aeruginosa]HBP1729215.1 DEAD/DEAH box helicase family protein [Pseudomonas aeruginosa]HCF2599563.1 DEAD/DEAH box helicase family protein [Pseudomonas aeruginosa]HEJ9826932.1 DEAD/DEAH box helicase family protein [Pseudomonas aeruginosa]